jgi:hypothetical protein
MIRGIITRNAFLPLRLFQANLPAVAPRGRRGRGNTQGKAP